MKSSRASTTPTPAPARKPGRPRLSAEASLLEAMERLLSQGQSFSALTVETLASEAGIARATFYLRFKDKSALVASLLATISDEIVESSGRWFGGANEADPALIHSSLRGIVHAFKRHQAVLAAVAETVPFDATVAQLHQQMIDRLRAESRGAFAKVRQQGHASPMADDALADLLTDMIELYCSRHLKHLDDAGLNALAERLAYISSNAIFSPEALQAAQPASAPKRTRKAR